jgi:hypothetical protein
VIGVIGAGPLESMIFKQGDHAMDLVEPQADRDVVLLEAGHSHSRFGQGSRATSSEGL